MKKRILIAPNSFKECANSVEIANLLQSYLSVIEHAEFISKPISDGGDGFLEVCKYHFGGEFKNYHVSTAFDSTQFECRILHIKEKKEIFIESAEVLGLKVVPMRFRNPLKLSSKGLGELLKAIEQDIQEGIILVQRAYIGIGGTATIDMGLGMMSELGLNLLDSEGNEINVIPENLTLAEEVNRLPERLSFEVIPVIDVSNPLLGKSGGVYTYGSQKGADEKMLLVIENNFTHILNLLKNNNLKVSSHKLSGAGGGIPAAFQIFNNSPLISASEFILNKLGMDKLIDGVDYIITGEGAYDHQSGFGKGAGIIIENFRYKVNRIFLVCGKIDSESISKLPKNVKPIELRHYFQNKSASIKFYRKGLQKAANEILKEVNF